jgi:hypothetical protein
MLSKFDKICTLALLLALCLPGCKEGNGGGPPDNKGQKGQKIKPEEGGEPGSDDEGEEVGGQEPNSPRGEGDENEPEGEANAPTGGEGEQNQPRGGKKEGEGLILENPHAEGSTIAVTVRNRSRTPTKLVKIDFPGVIDGFTVERVEGDESCKVGQDFKNSCFLYFKIKAPTSDIFVKKMSIPLTLTDGNGKTFPDTVTQSVTFKQD